MAAALVVWGLASFSAVAAPPPPTAAPTIQPPTQLGDVDLVYPKDAFLEAVDGPVTVGIELDDHGVVQRVVLESAPDPRLAWAALGAATSLRFSPAAAVTDDGNAHPIAVRFSYTFTFAIDEVERQHLLAHDADGDDGHSDDAHHDEDTHRPAPISVTGTVRIAGEDGVVEAAFVSVEGGDDDDGVSTDKDGHFALRGLAKGEAVLLIDAAGFELGHVEIDVGDTDEVVDVTAYLERRAEGGAAEMIVRGRHLRREVVKRSLTQAVTVLDQEALARVYGRSLAGTVSEVAGVTMVQSSPAAQKPVVRGLFGRRLLLLTDGIRLEGQDWGIDHAPEFDPAGASEISVVKGAAGVRFGADAIGGVILVEPAPLREAPGIDADLNLFGIDNGYAVGGGGRVDVVFAELPSVSMRLEANGLKGGAVSSPTYVLGNTGAEQYNVGATVAWRGEVLARAVDAKLSLKHHQSTLGICYCLAASTPENLLAASVVDRPVGADDWTVNYELDRPRQEVKHETIIARTRVDLGDVGQLSATYAFQLDLRDEFDQVRASVSGPQFSFQLATNAIDVDFEHAPIRLFGASLRGHLGARADMQTHAYSGLQLIPNFLRGTAGVFGLESLRLDDVGGLFDLEFLFGVRGDGLAQSSYLSTRAFESQKRRGQVGDDDCVVDGDAARCDRAMPALSVTVGTRAHVDLGGGRNKDSAHDELVLLADLSSATRFPDVDELYLSGRAPSAPVFGVGNAGLGPERTLQLSLGAELSISRLVHVEGGAFASHISDYIAFGPELNDDGAPIIDVLITGSYPRFAYQAIDAMISGVDGVIVVGPDSPVSASAQLAVVRGLDLTNGAFIPFIPPNQARFELTLRLPDNGSAPVRDVRLATNVVVVARQDRSDARSDFVPPADGYTLWNANANCTVDVVGAPVDLGLEVRNILNTRYRDQLSLMRFFADQPGREIWLRAAMHFDVPFTRDRPDEETR